jgi:plastocyanin
VPRHWEANPEIGEKPLFNSDGSPVLVNGVQQYQQNGRMLAPQDQRAASAAGYQPQTVQARPGDKIDLQVEAATDYDSWTTSSSGGYEPDGIKYQWSVVPPDGVTVGTLTNATSPHAQWTVPSGTTAGTYTLKCTIDDTWDTDAASIKPPGETGNRNDASLVRSVQVVVSSQASWAEFKVLTKEDGLESRDGVENDEKYDPIGGTVWPMLYLHIGPGEHVDPSIQSVTLRIEDIEPEVAGQTDPLPYWEHDISFLDDANMATWEMYKENDNEGNPLPEEQRWVKVASLTEGDAATVRLFRAKFAWDTTTKPLGLNGSHNIRVSKVTDTNPATVDENLTQVRFVASGIPYESGPAVRVVNVQNVQDVKDLYYSLDSRPLPTNGKQWTKVPMPGDADHPNADYPLVVGQAETVFFKVGKKLDAYDWPDGKPVWAGDADGIMQAEPGKDVMGVAFLRASTPDNDLQTISATCTNTVTASVRVKKSYVLTVAPEDGQPTQLLAGGADNRSKTAMVVHLTDAENQPVSNTAVNLSSMYVDEDGNPTTVAAGNIGGTGVQTNPDGSKYITLDQQGTGHFLLTTYTVPTPLGGAMVEGSLQDAAMPVKKEGSSLEFLSPNVNAESKDWEQVSSSEVGYLQSEHIFVLDFAGSPVGNRKVSIRVTGISEVNSDGSETPLTFDNVNKIENWATFESGPDNQNPDIFFTGDGTNNSVGAIVVNLVWLMPGINPRDYKIYYEVLDMHTP